LDDGALEASFGPRAGTPEQVAWARFQLAIANRPSQVLRHANGVARRKPVLPRPGLLPDEDALQGRTFEFQILPQALFYVQQRGEGEGEGDRAHLGSLDFSTLAVYTHQGDEPRRGPGYHEEVAYLQASEDLRPQLQPDDPPASA